MGGYGGGCVGHGCGHGLDMGDQVRPIVLARLGKVGLVADPLGLSVTHKWSAVVICDLSIASSE